MATAVTTRPMTSRVRVEVRGRRGRTKSMVTSDAAALRALSRLDMMAATSAVRMSPLNPAGSSSKASAGNTRSGLSRSGKSWIAIIPGMIMRKTLGSLRSPPKSAPRRASSRLRAASIRCTKYWFRVQ